MIHATKNHIYFYNNSRYQKRLRCMTPMEFYYAYAAQEIPSLPRSREGTLNRIFCFSTVCLTEAASLGQRR